MYSRTVKIYIFVYRSSYLFTGFSSLKQHLVCCDSSAREQDYSRGEPSGLPEPAASWPSPTLWTRRS